MPSSSRKQRHSRRQKKLVDVTPTSSVNYSSPRPYHRNSNPPPPPPPPPHQTLQDRESSTESKLSEITFDDYGSGPPESLFEYSDTSDDADVYFLPQENNHNSPSLLDNIGTSSGIPGSTSASGGTKGLDNRRTSSAMSGESIFREMKKEGIKSCKIVRFPDDSEFDETNIAHSKKEDTIPPTAFKNKNSGPMFGKLMEKMTHAFGGSQNENDTKHQRSMDKKAAGHRRKSSQTVTEYPYSMINLRDGRALSQHSALKDLSRSSLENSPLLTTPKRESYGIYEAGNSSMPSDYHPLKASASTSEIVVIQSTSGEDIEIEKPSDHSVLGSTGDSDSGAFLVSSRRHCSVIESRSMAAKVAAYFLIDYENSRIATLPSSFENITVKQLKLYKIYFSWQWRWFVNLAIIVLFLSHTQNLLATAIMHTCVIVVFAVEIHIRENMYGINPREDTTHTDRKLVRPMVAFLVLLGLETWTWWKFSTNLSSNGSTYPLYTSFLKPLVFFYVSSRARESLEAIWRISQIVVRVLVIECLLILTFAAVACRMFGHQHDSFQNLRDSWIHLFALSTTVNNPSIWMPIYATNPSYSIFFVIFIITCVFYYHSLVLSVVFQTYIQAVTEIHEQTASDRDDAIRLAFLALLKDGQSDYISISSVRKCLQVVRPHYNILKMNALLEIVDPSNEHIIDYPTFRNKIRRALNSSVRTARTATPLVMGVEFIAVLIAGANFIYVITVNGSRFQHHIYIGTGITLLGLFEVIIRFNPLKIQNFSPITRLNVFFDGLAVIAALVSCVGIVQFAAGYGNSIQNRDTFDFLHVGRAIDMIRIMRFFPIFRDIVRRSSDVLPAMGGPLILEVSVIHIFVCLGMLIWGGAINVGTLMKNAELAPLYCLNNFNSYKKGMITMFNIAVVNDWHQISKVFLFADRNSSETIVNSFFISAIFFMVYIMMNVITAFFVESFVTKSTDPVEENQSGEKSMRKGNFKIQNCENTNARRVRSSENFSSLPVFEDNDDDDDYALLDQHERSVNSAVSSTTSVFAAFDIYEREGFDQIMRTVTGMSDGDQEAFARSVCNYLERFESLTSGREKVGYMVCCQQSMNRFGNRRFQSSARCFLTDDTLHKVVSDMHSELLALTSTRKNSFGNRCLVRSFPRLAGDSSQHLEIAATLLRHQPAATLFVSRIRSITATSDIK